MMLSDLRSMTLADCRELMKTLGEKDYRAEQLFSWIHEKRAASIDDMTNLSKALRGQLKENLDDTPLVTVRHLVSKLDGTEKFAFRLPDGNVIETVLMKYEHGDSVCISSQAGCRMGCAFCASTLRGLVRNLTPGEMLSQIYAVSASTGKKVSNVVIMGTGEPLDNYDNVIRFLRLITDPKGYDLSARSITLSTCGLVPAIHRLSEEGLPITLAISLHAPDDFTRRQIMPIAKRYAIDEVLEAADAYFKVTGRRVTCEYSLIAGVNDSEDHAHALGRLLRGRGYHVNLISVNPIRERNYRESAVSSVAAFKKILEKYHINVTIRKKLGADIDSACGQLRLEVAEDPAAKSEET